MSDMLAAALAYAKDGWPVLPLHTPVPGGACDCPRPNQCDSPGKHPRTQHGLKDATTDELTIQRWWRTWPHANVGLAVPEGWVIIDVDGQEGLDALKEGNYQLPPTAIQSTGRGTHYVYRTASRFAPKVGLLEKVDLRGPGSYVVAAPSLHYSGAVYEWTIPLDEASSAPPWLSALVDRSRARSGVAGSGGLELREVLSGLPEGRRDVEIFRAACKLRAIDLPMDMAISLVREAAAKCAPPFDQDVAEYKVRAAYKTYPTNAPVGSLPAQVTLLGPDSVLVEFETAQFVFTELEKTSRELQAEMEVTLLAPGLPNRDPYVQRLNLLSMSSRDGCRRELEGLYGKNFGWTALLASAVTKAQDAYLKIDRAERFSQIAPPDRLQFVVADMVPENGLTILFGSGSSLKTYLLYAMALSVSRGLEFLERKTQRRKVMLIDYETGRETAAYRMRRVAEGMGLPMSAVNDVHFWWADGIPLPDQVESIKRSCEANGVGLVMLDHLAVACGADASDQTTANRMQRAMARLNLPIVAIGHVSSEAESAAGPPDKPFGSIFWVNAARRTILVIRHQDTASALADVSLFCKKSNDGARPIDVGGQVQFTDPGGPIFISRGFPGYVNRAMEQGRSPEDKIAGYLAQHNAVAGPDLARELGLTPNQVKQAVYKSGRFTNVGTPEKPLWAIRRPDDGNGVVELPF